MEKVSEVVRNFVVDNFLFGQETKQLAAADSFLEKGIVDSTGILELVTFLEEKYAIKVLTEELVPENLDSINNLTQFVQRKLQGTA